MSGTLYLCGTPIGNLEDISFRAIELLKTVDLIAAEDTRHTLHLLNHFQINTTMTSYHEHNKQSKGLQLLEKLKQNSNIALVTDAGMPGISDPGADLIKLCYKNDIPVTVVPGASACIVALVLSGLDTRRFVFEGFLPSDKKERRIILESLSKEHRTMILYEAPHRLLHTLEELSEVLEEDRTVVIMKELTKKFEQRKKDTLKGHIQYYMQNTPKGEFVLAIDGFSLAQQKKEAQQQYQTISMEEHMANYLSQGLSKKEAIKQIAKDRGVSKREIYAYYYKK